MQEQRTGRIRPRLTGFDYIGRHTYHLTLVTHQRQPVLVDSLAEIAAEKATGVANATNFDVLAYCIMPDHCHLLLQGREEQANLLRFVKTFKQISSFEAKRALGLNHLWQQSFHDHVLRETDNVIEIARYMIENPVVACLVDQADEWPYSGGMLVGIPERDGPKGSSLRSI